MIDSTLNKAWPVMSAKRKELDGLEGSSGRNHDVAVSRDNKGGLSQPSGPRPRQRKRQSATAVKS